MGQAISRFARRFFVKPREAPGPRNYVLHPGSLSPDPSEVMEYTDPDVDAVAADLDDSSASSSIDGIDGDSPYMRGALPHAASGAEWTRRSGFGGEEETMSPLQLRRPAMYDEWFGESDLRKRRSRHYEEKRHRGSVSAQG